MTKLKLTSKDRAELAEWNDLVVSIKESSDINPMDTTADIQARRRHLEKDPESWFRYYFEMYCTSEAAEFHKAATHRILTHERWYEVRAWSRELAKSARAMMEISYLALTGKIRNVLLISNSLDNAERLLLPFMANFEENQRIIQDYGPQRKLGEWETGEFTLRSGCSFRAIGAGQSPRGTRNKNVRPDFILIDDIDTDEECRNVCIGKIPHPFQWEHHCNGLLYQKGHRKGEGTPKAARYRTCGHYQHQGQERTICMAGKKLGRGYRYVPLSYQHFIGAEGVL